MRLETQQSEIENDTISCRHASYSILTMCREPPCDYALTERQNNARTKPKQPADRPGRANKTILLKLHITFPRINNFFPCFFFLLLLLSLNRQPIVSLILVRLLRNVHNFCFFFNLIFVSFDCGIHFRCFSKSSCGIVVLFWFRFHCRWFVLLRRFDDTIWVVWTSAWKVIAVGLSVGRELVQGCFARSI